MSWTYSEQNIVQEPAAKMMEAVGWTSVLAYDAETFGPNGMLGRADKSETVLWRSVRAALKRINGDWITDAQIEEAIEKLKTVEHGKSLMQLNSEAYEFVRDGVKVTDEEFGETGEAERRAKLIDFDDPTGPNNEFLCVRELWVTAPGFVKRPDLIGFVNGLPLLFMEFKKPSHKDKEGYDKNYKDYLAAIPGLFRFNAMLVFSNGNETHIGALGSDWEFFGEWKRHAEDDKAVVSLKKLIEGVCPRANFLDLVENFILFDSNDGNMFKVFARNHQYLGVNNAYESYLKRREKNGKIGVFWHTQGSGKSYSMVFLARKILRKSGGSPSFLIVTDRDELNEQIAGTFASCGCLGDALPKSCMPSSGERLRKRLEGNDRFLFTLIHKFNSSTWTPIHPDHEIVIFSDEAHRTNNGIFADNMLRFLPDASRIGFTGTPLQRGDLTEKQFGRYVSVYDFNRAVEDHATVPLFYKTRVNKLGIDSPSINQELIEAVEQEDLDPQDRKRVDDAIKSKIMIYMAPETIAIKAKDFVRDYSARWRSGKAMFVSVNKVAAYRTWKAVAAEWEKYTEELDESAKDPVKKARRTAERQQELEERVAWMKETRMELVISQEQGDVEYFKKFGIDIKPYKRDIAGKELEKDFKKAQNPFRVAFVCAMWLTGFDVPCLGTLYLDKPLKAHTLMQAIARANRVFEGKRNGVIVDYIGLIDALGRALADFTGVIGGEGGEPKNPLPPIEELLKHYEEAIAADVKLLSDNGFRLKTLLDADVMERPQVLKAAADAVATPDNVARAFIAVANKMDDIAKFIDSDELSDTIRAKRDAIREIRSHIEHHREAEKTDLTALFAELQQTIGDHVKNALPSVAEKCDEVALDLSKLDFSRMAKSIEGYKYKKLLLKQLSEKAEDVISSMIVQNPHCQNYYQALQEIIEEYNKAHDKAAIEKALQELLKLMKDVTEEQARYIREELDDNQQLAVFDILRSKEKLSPADLKRVKGVAKELLARLRALVSTVENWRDKASTCADVRTEIVNVLYADLPDALASPKVQDELLEEVYNYFYALPDTAA